LAAKPFQLLLIEDNPAHVMLVKATLRSSPELDYSLDVVTDGAAALDYLDRRAPFEQAPRPDLILLDLNIPKFSGMEVLESIKVNERLKAIPVVILTTTQRESDVQACYMRGANSFISKVGEYSIFKNTMQSLYDYWINCNQRLPQFEAQTGLTETRV
jgi:two-component system, chemotaxis family, response regulator Rcp1